MATKTETTLTRTLCKDLVEKYNCTVIPLVGHMRGNNGLPDRIIVHPRLLGGVWVEFKGHNTPITAAQAVWHRKLCGSGCPASFAQFSRDYKNVRVYTLHEKFQFDDTVENTASDFFNVLQQFWEDYYHVRVRGLA